MVNTPTSQERPPKSLSTVNRDGERAFVPPSRLAWAGGGANFPDRPRSFSAQTKGTVRLVNAFYVTYGPQTIDFAIFVSMNPPKRTRELIHSVQDEIEGLDETRVLLLVLVAAPWVGQHHSGGLLLGRELHGRL